MCDRLEGPNHAMHVGWVKSELEWGGFHVAFVQDEGEATARLRVLLSDPANSFELIVPPR